MEQTLFDTPRTRAGIVPRPYQNEAHDNAFLLWDRGESGVLMRMFTGAGKTLTACLAIDTWLRRGDRQRALVVSYEQHLVHQFAEEIYDYIGIEPGVEMDSACVSHEAVPQITVASRQSLLRATPPDRDQLKELATYDISAEMLGAVPKRNVKTYLAWLRKGADRDAVINDIIERNMRPEAREGFWSRLHKFDPLLNWLIVYDEAHKHAYKLQSVGHLVDWFDRNPDSRRLGLTATPKRGDGVSIGHKMLPGVAIDYPLYKVDSPCAVKDGYAVPYVQKYIEVSGVDFKNIKRVTEGGDFDEAALEQALGEESVLATLVTPLLDMAGERRTLIFSPGVEMAKNVARFINVRRKARCDCGSVRWVPFSLLEEGTPCACGATLTTGHVAADRDEARELDGETVHKERRETYRGHQSGEFQFLSVCGLCREGYNDPDVSCVAVFRPVSKKASSLAEQMKGRACRPCRAVAGQLHKLPDADSRRKAIAESPKPDALIVDLVGITGLADCASTVEIYAEGLPDEVKEVAEQLLAEATDEPMDVDAVIQAAMEAVAEEKERVKAEREAAEAKAREEYERRALADAQAKYTAHDVGSGANVDADLASDGQMKFIRFLGLQLKVTIEKRKAGRIIGQLKRGETLERIAYLNNFQEGDYEPSSPSQGQLHYAWRLGVRTWDGIRPLDVSLLIDAKKEPEKCVLSLQKWVTDAKDERELGFAGALVRNVKGSLPAADFDNLVLLGQKKRRALTGTPEPKPPAEQHWADDMIPY